MSPTCAECDARYPDGALHQSCGDARVFEESGGWLWLGPFISDNTHQENR
jgi:hypothetical protein